jgi:hypothetical protein
MSNLEVRELAAGNALTESQLDNVSGGQRGLSEIIGEWYEACGRLHLPGPSGNSFTDSLRCNTE